MAAAARALSRRPAPRHRPAAIEQGGRGGRSCSTRSIRSTAARCSTRWSRKRRRPVARPRSMSRSTSARRSRRAAAPIDEVGELVDAVRASPLPLAGLMAIPPLGLEPAPYFALLAKLARRHDVTGLSMGMSAISRRRSCSARPRSGSARRCSRTDAAASTRSSSTSTACFSKASIEGNRLLAELLTELGHPHQRRGRARTLCRARPAATSSPRSSSGSAARFRPNSTSAARQQSMRALREGDRRGRRRGRIRPLASARRCRRRSPRRARRAGFAAHLDHLGLADAFGDHVYSGREHVERGKPAPDLYLHAAERLGVDDRPNA